MIETTLLPPLTIRIRNNPYPYPYVPDIDLDLDLVFGVEDDIVS